MGIDKTELNLLKDYFMSKSVKVQFVDDKMDNKYDEDYEDEMEADVIFRNFL